jgi:hypothetical protein
VSSAGWKWSGTMQMSKMSGIDSMGDLFGQDEIMETGAGVLVGWWNRDVEL